MDAMTLLSTRASVRDLIAPGPGQAELEQILTVAMRAPDHGRLRPWRFIVIEGDERLAFGELLAQALCARQPEASAAQLEKERKKPLQAPTIVIVSAAVSDHPKVPAIEQTLAAGAAAQTAMLAFHALGYGAIWRTGEAAYDPLVKRGLGLASSDMIIGFLYAGTPDPAFDSTDRATRPRAYADMWRWQRLDLEKKTGFSK